MKNPATRILMPDWFDLDGFNLDGSNNGWIEFETGLDGAAFYLGVAEL